MLLDSYRIYVGEIISLVDSMVIKSELDADKINDELILNGVYVNLDDKTTWKYYLNLTGQYHDNDRRINILSSDTQELIELNKENLALHPITKIEYGAGGKYHDSLIYSNANSRLFIDGVFADIKMDTIIDAKDFTVLHFNTKLVADNEIELMDEVQDFIYKFTYRWHNADYAEVDSLYPAGMFDLLYKTLVTAIINIRTSFCNTSQVSQFHLWSKLKGIYQLDQYKDDLSLTQALWLYRNTRHLIQHAGSQYLLEDLITNLAETSSLEAFKYDYVKVEGNLNKSLVPDGRFVKRKFDDKFIDITDEEALVTEEVALFECLDEAPLNRPEFDYDLNKLKLLSSDITVNEFPVGLVKIEPKSDVIADRFNDQQFKLDYWVYLSSLGLFNGAMQFTLSGFGTVTLTPKQALILYIYANTRASGVVLETIPEPRVFNVNRVTIPVVNDFVSKVDSSLVSEADIEEALTGLVTPEEVNSFEEFDKFVTRVVTRRIKHDLQWQGKETSLAQSQLRDVIYGAHISKTVKLAPDNTNYIDWFGSIKLSSSGVSDNEWYTISLTILKTLLDIDPSASALPSSQRSVIEIIDKLSGYGVIITSGESRLGYQEIDYPFMVTDNTEEVTKDTVYGSLSELRVTDDPYSSSTHTVYSEFELASLDAYDEDADIVRADADTGLSFETELYDFNDMIVNVRGFDIEVID